MTDVDQNSPGDCDDELKQALLAAFGEDALELLDDDVDEIPDEMLSSALAEMNDLPTSGGEDPQATIDFTFFNQLLPSERDSKRYRWAKELYRAIYAPGTESNVQDTRPDLSPTAARSTQNRFVVFAIGNRQFAIPLQDVREITHNQKITSLPRTASWLRGVTSLRGQIMSVTDLRHLLQLSDPRPNVGEKIIVIQSRRQSTVTALVVDRIIGIRANTSAPSDSTELSQDIAKVTSGSATFEQSETVMIDTEKLFECQELMAYAEPSSTVDITEPQATKTNQPHEQT